MPRHEVLYSFASPSLHLLETKRVDLPPEAPPAQRFQWMVVPAGSRSPLNLDFVEMGDGMRAFREARLVLTGEEAELELLGKHFPLRKAEPSPELSEVVDRHLFRAEKAHRLFQLRLLKPSDWDFFQRWITDPEVIRYSMTKFHRLKTHEQGRDWFRDTLMDARVFQYGITDPSTGALIGYAGVAGLNEVDGNGEYFIFIGDKSHWGKGIATAVTREIVAHAFRELGLHRIFLTASSSNPGALRAYERAGFVHEGRMREAFFRGGERSDKIVMGLLRKEARL